MRSVPPLHNPHGTFGTLRYVKRPPATWADELQVWYRTHGRHDLPWRRTSDPWAVLVSEVMLQQTQVARVVPRWQRFIERWPDPAACAGTPIDDVLRQWQGLGYPRRALALHQTATIVATGGWPRSERGLRALPGIGPYTARALLAFAFADDGGAPLDVNLRRVGARVALNCEAHDATDSALDHVLTEARPAETTPRDHAYALFDLGALVCTARIPHCVECPITALCRSATRLALARPIAPPGRQPRYRGSLRELRGAILRAHLSTPPPATKAALQARLTSEGIAADPARVAEAWVGLHRDGLLAATAPGDMDITRSGTVPGDGD